MEKEKITLIAKEIAKKIIEENLKIQNPVRHKSLPLCLIEAVYSLMDHYKHTRKIVANYVVRYIGVDRQENPRDSLQDLIDNIKCCFPDDEEKACRIFAENKLECNRVAPGHSKRLRTQVVLDIAERLIKLEIRVLDDIKKVKEPEVLREEIRKVSGIDQAGVDYFFIMTGVDNRSKIDRHIDGFIKKVGEVKGIDIGCLSYCDGIDIMKKSCEILRVNNDYKDLTVAQLDRTIWMYMSENDGVNNVKVEINVPLP